MFRLWAKSAKTVSRENGKQQWNQRVNSNLRVVKTSHEATADVENSRGPASIQDAHPIIPGVVIVSLALGVIEQNPVRLPTRRWPTQRRVLDDYPV